MPIHIIQCRWHRVGVFVIAAGLTAASGGAQTARLVRGAPAVEALPDEPPAKIVVDPPHAEALSEGRVVIQYRTENLHIAPVFGPAALAVSPRVGHIHVTVDDATWVWADASGEPVILNGLAPGPHKVLLQLESANHQELDHGLVRFAIPDSVHPKATHSAKSSPVTGKASHETEPPAKITIDAPQSDRLARGVVFLEYRIQNLQVVPVYGPAALAVSPLIGHIHVTVDDATWHWADASGNPVIINGLLPGSHKVLIQLVDADHQTVDEGTVRLTIPQRGQ